jgi:hypothetical protein
VKKSLKRKDEDEDEKARLNPKRKKIVQNTEKCHTNKIVQMAIIRRMCW